MIPVQNLTKEDDLVMACRWLEDNAPAQKTRLEEIMPEYIQKAYGMRMF